MLEKKKNFIFDMDGTLIDSEKMHLDLWTIIFEEKGVQNGIEVLKKVIGVTGPMSRKILQEETGNPDFFKEWAPIKAKMTDEFLAKNGMPVKTGAKELLQYLYDHHYSMVIVTSTRRVVVQRFLNLAGLDQYFPEENRICGDEVENSKPDPEGFLKAIEKHHFNKEDSVVVEDSKNGILAANHAGIDVIGVEDLVDISMMDCLHYTSLLEVLKDMQASQKKILITGFEAFDGDPTNPSSEVFKLLPDNYLNYSITKKVLPVDTSCFEKIKDEVNQYDIVIAMGLASSSKGFTIEQIGINIDDFRIPDNAGMIKNREKIHEEGADGYFSTLPIDTIIPYLNYQNIEMKISYNAGTYICNHLLYELGYHLSHSNVLYGFIHLPGNIELESVKKMVVGVIEAL